MARSFKVFQNVKILKMSSKTMARSTLPSIYNLIHQAHSLILYAKIAPKFRTPPHREKKPWTFVSKLMAITSLFFLHHFKSYFSGDFSAPHSHTKIIDGEFILHICEIQISKSGILELCGIFDSREQLALICESKANSWKVPTLAHFSNIFLNSLIILIYFKIF